MSDHVLESPHRKPASPPPGVPAHPGKRASAIAIAPAYDPVLARTFASAIEAAYNYYDNGTPISLDGYTIGPSIYVWELATRTFFGYVATGTPPGSGIPEHNLVVFRGTRTSEEAAYDLQWSMTPCTLGGTSCGNAASGQYRFYTGKILLENSLSQSMLAAVASLASTSLPIYVCGHSLGGGVATLWQNHELAISYLSALTSYPSVITDGPPPNLPAVILPPPTTAARRPSAAEKEAMTVR